MSVEIPENQMAIHERRQKIQESLNKFKLLIEEKFKDEELDKIIRALQLMQEVHLPQKDRSDGKPYAEHPLEVAGKVVKMSDKLTPDLIVAALLHDSVEDMPEILFAKRANRKFPKPNYDFKITDEIKKNYYHILKDWSFKEIEEQFGSKVLYYLYNLTNHDFDSLAEELPDLSTEAKIDFKNEAYASHVREIIKDSNLCLLKYADFSTNINLKNLSDNEEKYFKLKRKYASVIPIFIEQIKLIDENHQLFSSKQLIIKDLEKIYQEQYIS